MDRNLPQDAFDKANQTSAVLAKNTPCKSILRAIQQILFIEICYLTVTLSNSSDLTWCFNNRKKNGFTKKTFGSPGLC